MSLILNQRSAPSRATWEFWRQEISCLLDCEPGLATRLAKRVGVTPAAISQYKTGAAKPSTDRALAIIEFLREYCREVLRAP